MSGADRLFGLRRRSRAVVGFNVFNPVAKGGSGVGPSLIDRVPHGCAARAVGDRYAEPAFGTVDESDVLQGLWPFFG